MKLSLSSFLVLYSVFLLISTNGYTGTELSPWTTTLSLPTTLDGHAASYSNGTIYVMGGTTYGYDNLSTVIYSAINPDGSLANWQNTLSMPTALTYPDVAIYNNYLYVIGGLAGLFPSTNYQASVYFAQLNNGVENWQSTTPLPQVLTNPAVVVNNGIIYVLGGFSQTVYYATINGNGTLGSWQTTTQLPQRIGREGAVVNNGYIYVIGGYDDASVTRLNNIYYAQIHGDGTLGTWQDGTPLPEGRENFVTVSKNGKIYVIGGNTYSTESTVLFTGVNSDGSIGFWQQATSLPSPRDFTAGVLANDKIYILGGHYSGTYNSVFYTTILGEGTSVPKEIWDNPLLDISNK